MADKDHAKFLDEYRKTGNIMKSMMAAGWSESTARNGVYKLPKALQEQVKLIDAGKERLSTFVPPTKQPRAMELIEQGRETSKEDLQALALGRLGHELKHGDNMQAVKVALDIVPPEDEPIDDATARRICELADRLLGADALDKERLRLEEKERHLKAWEKSLEQRGPVPELPKQPGGPFADCSTGHHAWETIESNQNGWAIRKCRNCPARETTKENIGRTTVLVNA